jgi:hypothetical protein
MRFKIPRAILSLELKKIISQEMKTQQFAATRASQKQLQEIAAVSQEIEKSGLPKHLVCKKLPDGLGQGIFLHPKAKPVEKGRVIAPYSGIVAFIPQHYGNGSDYTFSLLSNLLLTKEEQLFFDPERKYHPRRLYSLDLDAEKRGNFTRFINHSEAPNLAAYPLKISKNTYGLEPSPLDIVYIAIKKIRPGEQLLVCYEDSEKSYWGALNIKPTPMTPKTFQLNSSLKVTKTKEKF